MKYLLPDGQELLLKDLSDSEYERARQLAPCSLDVCPTCGGHEERLDGGRRWISEGYQLNGERHECACQAQIALYARYVLANIGTQFMRLDWKDFAGVKEADKMVGEYTTNWRNYLAHGFGLTFASKNQGVGKTWAATHIGKELIKHRQKVYFIVFAQMVEAFLDDQKKNLVERRMMESTFLILDDVWAGISERQNDLYALKFEVVIRHRTNFNLPTIITTNLTECEFEENFGRIYSLIAPKQMWIEMNGVDYRKLTSTSATMAEMIARGEIQPIT